MSLVIQHNLMAQTAARNLRTSYGMLSDSIRKLSSGLRIDQSADDPAGMAVRELMRAEIASLSQGMRNANDAVSMIQTADGALSVIDEKLIRMKELALQASTGTYNSEQRLIIDSEYQQMVDEVDRIANSTDFNGIYLLNGSLSATHDGSGVQSTGQIKVHFGTGNESAEDYYYISIKAADFNTLMGLSEATASELHQAFTNLLDDTETALQTRFYNDYVGLGFPPNAGTQATADTAAAAWRAQIQNAYDTAPGGGGGNPATVEEFTIAFEAAQNTASTTDESDAGYGGAVGAALHDSWEWGDSQVLNYSPTYRTGTGADVRTQSAAQNALEGLTNAIVSKDNIRANLGALQNRLENTVANLDIQRENLQAAESRISDVDVSLEMTNFVRNQIVTQAAAAMLAQANTMPRMALQLLGG